ATTSLSRLGYLTHALHEAHYALSLRVNRLGETNGFCYRRVPVNCLNIIRVLNGHSVVYNHFDIFLALGGLILLSNCERAYDRIKPKNISQLKERRCVTEQTFDLLSRNSLTFDQYGSAQFNIIGRLVDVEAIVLV